MMSQENRERRPEETTCNIVAAAALVEECVEVLEGGALRRGQNVRKTEEKLSGKTQFPPRL